MIGALEHNLNESRQIVREMLEQFSDEEVAEMAKAAIEGRTFEPLFAEPLPRLVAIMLAPTIYSEMKRRWECAELDNDTN